MPESSTSHPKATSYRSVLHSAATSPEHPPHTKLLRLRQPPHTAPRHAATPRQPPTPHTTPSLHTRPRRSSPSSAHSQYRHSHLSESAQAPSPDSCSC